uniref:RecA-like N-terminal domain-containing protein n=1 Tax=Opuntia streptacantha TaxID=393608 RepID=A0A7C9ESI6_OPUST
MSFLRSFRLLRSSCLGNAIHGLSPSSSLYIRSMRRDAAAYSVGMQSHSLSTVGDVAELEFDELIDGGEVKEKDTALHVAITQLASEFGKESMLSLSNFFSPRFASVISTGSLKLDLALGIGGLPKVMDLDTPPTTY